MNKHLFTSILLVLTLAASLLSGKAQFKSIDVVSQLNIPLHFNRWQGQNAPNAYQTESQKPDFIAKTLLLYYWIPDEANLSLLLINAGNFHNPRTCYTGSGYTPKEYANLEIELSKNVALKGESYIMQKSETEAFFTTYWMIVDGRRVDWLEQKFKEFFFALINKRRANLMVRIDVPLYEVNQEVFKWAENVTRLFIQDLYKASDTQDKYYIFGGIHS